MRARELVQHYPAHTKAANSLQFHHSGDFILSSSDDGTVKVRSRPRWEQIMYVSAIALSNQFALHTDLGRP